MPAIGGAGAAAHQHQQNDANQQWKKAQAANAGGHVGNDGYTTNFEGTGGLMDLRAMVMHADPDAIHTVSAQWTTIGASLDDTAHELTTHVNNLLGHWSGKSADAFRANATNLHTSLSNGAQYAHTTSGAMSDAAIALAEAQRDMPAKPGLMARASRAVTSETGDIQFKNDAASQGLSYAVQHDGAQLSAMEQAHQQAVLVMETVGTKYNAAAAKLTTSLGGSRGDGGVWPPPPTTGGPVGGGPVTGTPVHKPITTTRPVTKPTPTPVEPVQGPTPIQPPPVHHPGPVTPVHGQGPVGHPAPPPAPPGTTLDGGKGGPTTGTGTGLGGSGSGGVGGVGGVGGGSGHGAGGAGGVAVGGAGFGGGGGGLASGLGGGGYGGRGGLGSSGLAGERAASESASAVGEGDGILAGGKKGAAEGAGEGKSGTGMGGGMGGAGRGAGNKKKRKGRAAYLLEDDETWAQEGEPNPPVIG